MLATKCCISPRVRKLEKRDRIAIPSDEWNVMDEVLGMSRYWWLTGAADRRFSRDGRPGCTATAPGKSYAAFAALPLPQADLDVE